MKFKFLMSLCLVLLTSSLMAVVERGKAPKVPPTVEFRYADIISEGTRIQAEVYAPKNTGSKKLPTILMSHGWGGTALGLRWDAITFAEAGFLVVAIDYRGWGNSDGRLILDGKKKLSKKTGKLVAEVKEIRGVVDPIDQTTDILNALQWLHGEKKCDTNRIGIWGSSFCGGHVVYVAARDPRVKAFVSQVGSMDQRTWTVGGSEYMRNLTFQHGMERTHGKRSYPKEGELWQKMLGYPILEKVMQYGPIADIHRVDKVAKLFITAEHEELFKNEDNADLAYKRANGVKKLVEIKGIKHYGIYTNVKARKYAQQLAIDWYKEHLK